MIQDYQGFPAELYSECMSDEQIESAIEFANLTEDEQEMVEDYISEFGLDGNSFDINEIKCQCYGNEYFSTFAQESAEQELDNIGAPEFCRQFFDYKEYERCLRDDFYVGSNYGYIFMR